MEICQLKVYIQKDSCVLAFIDKMAEWLRQLTVNPLGSTCVGSNPIFGLFFIFGSVVKLIGIWSLNSAIQVQISEKNWYLENLSHHLLRNLEKNKISEERITGSEMF